MLITGLQATSHGNKPSRGARIDKELQAEDEAMLAKKKEKSIGLGGQH